MKMKFYLMMLAAFLMLNLQAQTPISLGLNTGSNATFYYKVQNNNTAFVVSTCEYLPDGDEYSIRIWREGKKIQSYSAYECAGEGFAQKGDSVVIRFEENDPFYFDFTTRVLTELSGRTPDKPKTLVPGSNVVAFPFTYFEYTFPSDGTISLWFETDEADEFIPIVTSRAAIAKYGEEYFDLESEIYQLVSPFGEQKISGKKGTTIYFTSGNMVAPFTIKTLFSSALQPAGNNRAMPFTVNVGANTVPTFVLYQVDFEYGNIAYLKYTAQYDTGLFILGESFSLTDGLEVEVVMGQKNGGDYIIGTKLNVSKDSTYFFGIFRESATKAAPVQLNIEYTARFTPEGSSDFCSLPVTSVTAGNTYTPNFTGNEWQLYSFTAPYNGYFKLNFANNPQGWFYPYDQCSDTEMNSHSGSYPMTAGQKLNIALSKESHEDDSSFSITYTNGLGLYDVSISSASSFTVDTVNGTISGEILKSRDFSSVYLNARAFSDDVTFSISGKETGTGYINEGFNLSTGSKTFSLKNSFGASKTYTLNFTQAAAQYTEAVITNISIEKQIGATVKDADTFRITIPAEEYLYISFESSKGSNVDKYNVYQLLEGGKFGTDSVIYGTVKVTSEDGNTTKNYKIRLSVKGLEGSSWEKAITAQLGVNTNAQWTSNKHFTFTPAATGIYRIQNLNMGSWLYYDVLTEGQEEISTESEWIDGDEFMSFNLTANQPILFYFLYDVTSFEITKPALSELSASKKITEMYPHVDKESVTIDTLANEVNVVVEYGLGQYINSMDMYFELSQGAKLEYGGKILDDRFSDADFTSTVIAKVIAENGTFVLWKIKVSEALPKTEKAILAFVLPGQVGDAIVDKQNKTISLTVASGTSITSVAPLFLISEKAKIYYGNTLQYSNSSKQNFTNDVVYKIIAEDGSSANWTVKAKVASAADADIISFSTLYQVESSVIDKTARIITNKTAKGSDLTKVVAYYTLSPGASLKYNNTAVVSGTTALDFSKGTLNLTVTPQTGAGVQWSVKVQDTVVNDIPVASLSFNELTHSIVVGQSKTLTVNILPADATDKSLKWSVTDTSIATVNSQGLIMAKKAGTTSVNVRTNDGNKLAVATIIVTNAVVSVADISIVPTSVNMLNQTIRQLKAEITPLDATNQKVVWTSSNEAIAEVNSLGIVTANSVGTVTITATTNDGAKTATCQVTVTNTVVAINSVALSPAKLSLILNGTYQLLPRITPANATNQEVSWSSSDTTVATVTSEGFVVALKAGKSNITVSTKEGNKTATVEITVITGTMVSNVSIAPEKAQMGIGTTFQLTASVLPNNASNKAINWESSDTTIVKANSNGLLTALKRGNATVIARTVDGSNNFAFVPVEVYYVPEICLVTSSKETYNNLVVWEDTRNLELKEYIVYRRDKNSSWEKLATVSYGKQTVYEDPTCHTCTAYKKVNQVTYVDEYLLTAVDKQGRETPKEISHPHTPIFLTYRKENAIAYVEWEPYKVLNGSLDFDSYNIYIGTDSSNMAFLDNVPKTINKVNIDLSKYSYVLQYRTYFQVEAGIKKVCTPFVPSKANNGPFSHAISNLEDNRLRQEFTSIASAQSIPVEISPNPVKDLLKVKVPLMLNGKLSLQVINLYGVTCLKQDVIANGELLETQLDLTHLESGIYLLRLESADGLYVQQFVKE